MFVEDKLEPRIEAGVTPQALLDVFEIKREFGKKRFVGLEFDERSVGFLRRSALALRGYFAFRKYRLEILAVAKGRDPEVGRKAVDRLGADAV